MTPAYILLFSALLIGSYAASRNEPEVHTPLGRVKGSLMTSRLNKTIYAFRAIRYAKSPEGERRFKPAEPVDPWRGVFDATKEGPSCPLYEAPELSSEDCLLLNVYATKLPRSNTQVKRPVIVFFHPGGFYGFSAQSYVFGPQYYMDKDIVLVTVNYRLATLGFMATGDARAPGNLGLKDQVIALRWIQKNIAAFGGDPDSVTITGCSAGAWSTIYHMMSPMSKGLFHRIIAMSGAPTLPTLLPTEQKDLLLKQAGFVNCPNNDVDAAIECLKKVPHQNLSLSFPQFKEFYFDPTLIWSPVIEPEVPGVERFITAQPIDLLRLKKFQQVPIIFGITKDEFANMAWNGIEEAKNGSDAIFRNFTENWEYAAPISFQYDRNTEHSKYVSRELKKFYLNDEPITLKNARKFGEIYADSIIGFPVNRFAKLLAENSNAPMYYYQFTYQGKYSFVTMTDTKKPYGVMHQDDLQYLFYMSFLFPYLKPDEPENVMVEKLTSMWVNFAKHGEPIPRNHNLFRGVTWATHNSRNNNYLEIGEKLTMKKDMYTDRYALWDRLFPLPPVSRV